MTYAALSWKATGWYCSLLSVAIAILGHSLPVKHRRYADKLVHDVPATCASSGSTNYPTARSAQTFTPSCLPVQNHLGLPRQGDRNYSGQQHEERGNPQASLQSVTLINPAGQHGAEQSAQGIGHVVETDV